MFASMGGPGSDTAFRVRKAVRRLNDGARTALAIVDATRIRSTVRRHRDLGGIAPTGAARGPADKQLIFLC